MSLGKKIVFFDIDDTLLDRKRKLPTTTIDSIKQLQQKGIKTVIATARPPFLFETLRKELNIESYISFNGQYVVHDGEVIYDNPLNHEQLHAIYESSSAYDFPMGFVSESEMCATRDNHPYVKQSILLETYPRVDQTFHKTENVYQALLYCKVGKESSIKESHPEFYFQRWHPLSCDIIPKGASKAVGVQKILERENVRLEQSYAFGDGINDLEMFAEVGNSIAMGNAIEELKLAASYVTEDVENDGIMKGLQHYRLI